MRSVLIAEINLSGFKVVSRAQVVNHCRFHIVFALIVKAFDDTGEIEATDFICCADTEVMGVAAPFLRIGFCTVGVLQMKLQAAEFRRAVMNGVVIDLPSNKSVSETNLKIIRSERRRIPNGISSFIGSEAADTAERKGAESAAHIQRSLFSPGKSGFTFRTVIHGVGVFEVKTDAVAIAEFFGSFKTPNTAPGNAVHQLNGSGTAFFFLNRNRSIDRTVKRYVAFSKCKGSGCHDDSCKECLREFHNFALMCN